MGRACFIVLVALVTGCRLPPEHEPLKPLPETDALYTYQEIIARGRAQSSAALEAFYQDAWSDMEESAKGLQQTARILPKTIDQPVHIKESLRKLCGDLSAEAAKLLDAARAKSVADSTEALRRISLAIRALRATESLEKTKADKQ